MQDNIVFFLENDRVGLRILSEEDVRSGYGTWLNNADVCRYNSHHRFPVSQNSLREYVMAADSNPGLLVLAIVDKNSGKHIGNISLQQINLIDRNAEIAFLIGESAQWGKGYATTAGALLIDHAFRSLGLHRLFFGTSEQNIGMQKVGAKLGFKKAGTYREAIFKNGKYWNLSFYDLLDTEWFNSQTKGNGENEVL